MLFQKLKNIYHLLQAIVANYYYSFPSRRLTIIGVTGTNGKTTTTHLIGHILEKAGYRVGLHSTISLWDGKDKTINQTKFTTQDAFSLQKFLKTCLDNCCQYVVLETSSHSLDQYRTWGVDYDLGVITNVTREHLDYHRNMSTYRAAKLKLFQYLANKSKKHSGFSVVNLDMEQPAQFILKNKTKTFGYSLNPQNLAQNLLPPDHVSLAQKIKYESARTLFSVNDTDYILHLPGSFNVENALAAITVSQIIKIKHSTIRKALQNIPAIPGRMNYIKNKSGLKIIVDYALTPDSMNKVGQLIKSKQKRGEKLIWVFGSCGSRDQGKRPIMGKIAASFADYLIITNEDPYYEDPHKIIEDIIKGIPLSHPHVLKIFDRKKALKKALQIARKGDYILVTGKGAEENMKIKDRLIAWNDTGVIQGLLQDLKL